MTPQPATLDARQKRQVTLGYYLTFISLGVVTAALGPALPYLAAQTGTALAVVSVLFVSRALGLILGALLSGRLYDRLGHPILITIAALLTPLPTVLTLLMGSPFSVRVLPAGCIITEFAGRLMRDQTIRQPQNQA